MAETDPIPIPSPKVAVRRSFLPRDPVHRAIAEIGLWVRISVLTSALVIILGALWLGALE
jgi:hypothetical protein